MRGHIQESLARKKQTKKICVVLGSGQLASGGIVRELVLVFNYDSCNCVIGGLFLCLPFHLPQVSGETDSAPGQTFHQKFDLSP